VPRARPPAGALSASGPELDFPQESGDYLAFLNEVGGRLVGAIDLEVTASRIVELAVPTLADCAMLLLPDIRGRLEWWRWAGRGRTLRGRVRRPAAETAPRLTSVMVGEPLDADLLPELADLPRALGEPFSRHSAVTAVSVPASVTRGALLLARRIDHPFGSAEREAVQEFVIRAGRAIAAAHRFERQRAAADELTNPLRPPVLPVLPGIRMAAIYRPAEGPLNVGGDFYDIHLQEDGSSLFMLGDVCGKGAEAAAMSGRVRHALAALRLVDDDPQRLLRLLNQTLLGTGGSKFATLVLGQMTRRGGGSLLLKMSSGGHPPPLVLRRDGTVEVSAVPGMLVGIMPRAEFGSAAVELGPQDTIVLYTDGITEARGGAGEEQYGSERLRAVLGDCAGLPVEQIVGRIDEAVQRWSGVGSRDDIAVLAIQCAPGQ
jgi:phosphoserine phosphatase RsbU/P